MVLGFVAGGSSISVSLAEPLVVFFARVTFFTFVGFSSSIEGVFSLSTPSSLSPGTVVSALVFLVATLPVSAFVASSITSVALTPLLDFVAGAGSSVLSSSSAVFVLVRDVFSVGTADPLSAVLEPARGLRVAVFVGFESVSEISGVFGLREATLRAGFASVSSLFEGGFAILRAGFDDVPSPSVLVVAFVCMASLVLRAGSCGKLFNEQSGKAAQYGLPPRPFLYLV